MEKYQLEDFAANPAWLIFRIDTQVEKKALDIYFMMDLPTEEILSQETVEDFISIEQIQILIDNAQKSKPKKLKMPKRIIIAQGDPAQKPLNTICEQLKIECEVIPAQYLEDLVAPMKRGACEQFYSLSSIPCAISADQYEVKGVDKESFTATIPDSYDLCPCNSGKEYKFCCKPIFREINTALVAAADGNLDEALKYLDAARKIVGNTSEILGNEALIYSYFDTVKSTELLNQCIAEFPTYPKAYYMRGVDLLDNGQFKEAIDANKIAISLYPTSDKYHLNEAYANLGTAYYYTENLLEAKQAFEKALFFISSDAMAKVKLKLLEGLLSDKESEKSKLG